MIERTKHARTNYKMILPFVDQAENAGGAIRCKSSGYMDLSIEKLYYSDPYGNPVYSFTHYGEQNGDAMRDPDMEFSVNRETETIIPLSFRNDYVGVYHQVIQMRNGKQMYSSRMLKDLDDFLWRWCKNIIAQGFTPEKYAAI